MLPQILCKITVDLKYNSMKLMVNMILTSVSKVFMLILIKEKL